LDARAPVSAARVLSSKRLCSSPKAVLFEVSQVLGHRWVTGRRGRFAKCFLELLTQYSGYEDALPTWQPIEDFMERGVIINIVALHYLRENDVNATRKN